MILTPEKQKILSEINRTPYGKVLREYLDQALAEIGDINTTQNWEETLGRKFAIKLIKDLFGFMEEKKDTSVKKNNYV